VDRYLHMTDLPEETERALLELDMDDLCAMLAKLGGPRLLGAGDKYVVIQMIAKEHQRQAAAAR
jgi:hypothetical protein